MSLKSRLILSSFKGGCCRRSRTRNYGDLVEKRGSDEQRKSNLGNSESFIPGGEWQR